MHGAEVKILAQHSVMWFTTQPAGTPRNLGPLVHQLWCRL